MQLLEMIDVSEIVAGAIFQHWDDGPLDGRVGNLSGRTGWSCVKDQTSWEVYNVTYVHTERALDFLDQTVDTELYMQVKSQQEAMR